MSICGAKDKGKQCLTGCTNRKGFCSKHLKFIPIDKQLEYEQVYNEHIATIAQSEERVAKKFLELQEIVNSKTQK